MKRVLFVLCCIFLLISVYCYQSYTAKQGLISGLHSESNKIVIYSQWGYKTTEFEEIYLGLVKEAEIINFLLVPLRSHYFYNKRDNILRLTQAGYANEVIKNKEIIRARLTYLRDRVKMSDDIQQNKKLELSNALEVVAGNVFEKNIDINGLTLAFKSLVELDSQITRQVEIVRKESLMNELQGYRGTCADLQHFFKEKHYQEGEKITGECLDSADRLMGPGYEANGVEYLKTLGRERVYSLVQKAEQAKQRLIQEEQYVLLAKIKDEERLTLVPPAPLQEGKVIVVNLGLQRLFAYENGATLFPTSVPITTGKQGFETVTGEFAIYLKEQQHKMVSPFPGIYYDDVVNYWMPFYLGYGLHDASWRSIYGTQDYGVVGSHGCVNIPLNETVILYNWAEVGTKVILL